MGYLYETHLHTSNSSLCGATRAKDYIPYFLDRGYDGIFVTDHFYQGNTRVDRALSWKDWVHAYCDAFREAKEEGDRLGLKVFFGWEASQLDAADYLIYGLDEDWLLEHPEVREFNAATQYQTVHAAGGFVVTAHPFRERGYHSAIRLHPNDTDAWEVANAGNMPYMDIFARNFARDHGFHVTSGSDIHNAKPDAVTFGIETEEPLNSVDDYIALIKKGTGYKLHVPEDRYDGPVLNPCYPIIVDDGEGNLSTIPNEIIEGIARAEVDTGSYAMDNLRRYRELVKTLPEYGWPRK